MGSSQGRWVLKTRWHWGRCKCHDGSGKEGSRYSNPGFVYLRLWDRHCSISCVLSCGEVLGTRVMGSRTGTLPAPFLFTLPAPGASLSPVPTQSYPQPLGAILMAFRRCCKENPAFPSCCHLIYGEPGPAGGREGTMVSLALLLGKEMGVPDLEPWACAPAPVHPQHGPSELRVNGITVNSPGVQTTLCLTYFLEPPQSGPGHKDYLVPAP